MVVARTTDIGVLDRRAVRSALWQVGGGKREKPQLVAGAKSVNSSVAIARAAIGSPSVSVSQRSTNAAIGAGSGSPPSR